MASIVAVPYTPAHRAQWEDFVLRSNNGTMFHLQQFLDYHPAGKFRFHHLMFFKDRSLLAELPGGINKEGGFESPVGASYGGFVLGDVSFDDCLGLVDALFAHADIQGWNDITLTAAPFIYQAKLTQDIDYALLWRGFAYDCHYISAVIDLRAYGDDPLEHFDKTTRRTVRRITREANMRLEENADYEGFYPVLLENKARHNVKPTHSFEDLQRLRELMPERLVLFSAYLNDLYIAGSLNFAANPRVLLVFYNMLRYEYEEHRPVYLLMHRVVQYARQHGFDYVDIGVSQDTKADNPMTPSMNLIRFKERFDSRGVMRSTLRWRRS